MKATFVVKLRDSCQIPEHAFHEIEEAIKKHITVEKVTKVTAVYVPKKVLLAIRAQWVDVWEELEDLPETIEYLKMCAWEEVGRIDRILDGKVSKT